MGSTVARCARIACCVAVFASFVACGGVSDPGLFSASSSAGVSNRAGASSDGGASAHGGSSSEGGASNSAGDSAAGARSTDGGAANGGNSAAGSSGAAQAGAGNLGGTSDGGSANGGAGNGGGAGSVPNAGSGGEDETCQTLFAKASKQLAAAQVCSLAADSTQCTGTVKNLCKCDVPINHEVSAETTAYDATVEQLDKKKCVQLCSAIACFPATHAVCKASSLGSAAGTCVASYALPQ
ncbi:MAG: hypothetical protein ABIQ16_07110 [Polyangiaceae bacterium]